MADDLSIQCDQLFIEGEDDDIVDLVDVGDNTVDDEIELSLVGRIQSSRAYNFGAMKNTMNQMRSLSKRAIFREIENDLFIIQLFHWKDKEKVLNGRPWCFDHNLIVLQEIPKGVQPTKVVLDMSPFWIRIYDLPLDCQSSRSVRSLAGKVGEVLEVEESQ
ncbi:uncharacterized protein [Spinacia oleracea]|uniref:DUF4283 domain-containing protein n=1 Tax=Spinacia oleracea TaxID=3562 RepID=A0A9R0I3M6_SPIOL|nr:uncharacterized protein LOC110782226 [Spinacia oleracea]